MSNIPPINWSPPPLPENPPYTPPGSLTEYLYKSQFSMDTIGVVINVMGAPIDVDNQVMTVTAYQLPQPGTQGSPTQVWSHLTTRMAQGVYEYTMTSADSGAQGYFRMDWSFTLNSTPEIISNYYEFGPPSWAYDSLSGPFRQIVEDVWAKFADGYDSPVGGPNLQMWYQTHFNRGRLAQLLNQAIQHLNVMGQPVTAYTAYNNTGYALFPLAGWEGLVNTALTVEVLKHLMRSYAEDPDIQGAVQARMIRTNYMQRWGQMLEIEEAQYKTERDVWRIKQMFQMTPRVLVSGGAYGTYAPVRMIGNLAARPAMWWRFYGVGALLALAGAIGLHPWSSGTHHVSKTPAAISGPMLTPPVAPKHAGPGSSPSSPPPAMARWSCGKYGGVLTSSPTSIPTDPCPTVSE